MTSAGDPSPIDAVRRVGVLVESGDARAALALARDLFARGDLPRWLVAELCTLAGGAALTLGLEPAAEQLWREAIAADGRLAAAPAQLGRMLARQERDDEAEPLCRHALQLDPRDVPSRLALAGLLARHGEAVEAEATYREALALAPDEPVAWSDLGVLLATLKRHDEAERCYREALALAPDSPDANTNLGLLLATLGRWDEAAACQRRALAAAPGHPLILGNLGNLLARLGADDEAEALLRRAAALAPATASTRFNLGKLLQDRHRDAEAEAELREALRLKPAHALARMALATLLLRQGRFAEAWPLHEARYDDSLLDHGIPPPPWPIAPWRGEPLDGRSILVWPEQGLGDQIQFARYAGLLKARGAARVTLVCQQPLAALFASLANVDEVLGATIVDNRFALPGRDLGDHDCWAFPLSLPLWFRTELATVPAALPYLRPDAARRAHWDARLADGAAPAGTVRRVGLVWRGNPTHDNDADRSMPGLATLAPLWSVPGIEFIGLQTGRAAAEHEPAQPMRRFGHELRDFADTAALLAALDLLICVDTSIAHLAGATARPCWVMLPAYRTDWRWLEGRDDSPWYPGAMRLFRQPARGDWGAVVAAVRDALAVFVLSAPPSAPVPR